MNSIKLISIFACLVSSAIAAPTEAPAGQTSTDATTTATAPATEPNTTTPMIEVSSSFTCYGRSIGYYADPEQECRVYHFCLLGDFNGEPVYQRISYLCLNYTVFDQQALDCVDSAKVSAPCKDSANHYDGSNSILRQSIVGNKMAQGENPKNETTA